MTFFKLDPRSASTGALNFLYVDLFCFLTFPARANAILGLSTNVQLAKAIKPDIKSVKNGSTVKANKGVHEIIVVAKTV